MHHRDIPVWALVFGLAICALITAHSIALILNGG